MIILPDSEIRFTCPQFPGLHPFPDLVPGSHIHSLQLDALSQTLCLVHTSTVHSLTPFPRLCTWGHTSIISMVTPLPNSAPGVTCPVSSGPCTWVHTSTVSSVTLHPDSVPGVKYLQSLVWHPLQTLYLQSHVDSLQGDPPPNTQHVGSNMHSFQGDTPARP